MHSQIDTATVKLSEQTARKVLKDLVRGDVCAQELTQTNITLRLTEKKVDLQNNMILNLQSQESKSQEIISLKTEQLESKDKIIKATEKQLKKQAAVSWIYKIGTIVGVVTSGYLLLGG